MLLSLLDAFPIRIVQQKERASTIFAEIHALAHQMLSVESKITNRFAHANKAITDNRKFSVLTLDAVLMMNVQQHTHVSIVNAYQFVLVMVAPVDLKLNAMESIITPFVNVNLAMLAILKLDVRLSAVVAITNAQQTEPASIRNVKILAKKWPFANEMKFAEFMITSRNAHAHQERLLKRMDHVACTMKYADQIAIALHNWPVLTANALTHALRPNHVVVSFITLDF